jgi:hypothetical protein
MAEHHETAIRRFVSDAEGRAALGVIVVGSVARGTERPDSDVDLYEIVDDASFESALMATALAGVETEHCDWPGGYLDIKLVSATLLERAVTEADDATRASLIGARIELDRTGRLETLVADITAPPTDYFDGHVAAFGAQFALHADYFLPHGRAHGDALLAGNAAAHAAFAAGRMALAAERVLFRGPKYLGEQLRGAGRAELAEAAEALITEPTAGAVERVRALVPELASQAGAISDHDLALFITDNEWTWYTRRTPPEYR